MAAPTFDASYSELASRYPVKLRSSEYSITGEHVVLVMLGSSVAACLRGPYTGFGGMKRFAPSKAGGYAALLSRRACP
jgi:chemotaxis receptor (MCP) glutamine deamidase CheD